MPGRYDGPDHWAGGHEWAPLLFMCASLFFWVIAPMLMATALVWWRSRQAAMARDQIIQPIAAQPSPLELLRWQYVVGAIDVWTFAEMTERLLIAEQRDAHRQTPLWVGGAEGAYPPSWNRSALL
jgi:hypothetical protein